MAEFYLADVRKRAQPDLSMVPEAIPELRVFAGDSADAAATVERQAYQRLVEIFAANGPESPDDPVSCGVAGVTMEWAVGPTAGQVDFYAQPAEEEEAQRFLSLYIFSGASPEDDRTAMKHLEQYADFRQCRSFPLVVQVTDDPLPAAWQHEALQSMRQGIAALVVAFLQAYYPAQPNSVGA